jgi:hypothetical protein
MPFIKHQVFGKIILNKTFWLLTFSDLFTWGFYLIIATLSGVYLEGKIGHDIVKVIGIGGAIYYVIRGFLQLPVSWFLDLIKYDRDEITILALGSILMGLPFLFYPAITSPGQYYVLQVIFSLGVAMNLNPWRKLFATNLDHGKEAREYAIYDMINSVFIAGAVYIVGQIANINQFYFDVIMVCLGLLVMLGGLWAALIFTDESRRSSGLKKKTV